jgi:glycosyltransferase involved in cell wall biosynthesis
MKRIAVVHDWLVTHAGAEKVLGEILAVFPSADVFSLVDFVPLAQRSFLAGKSVRTSFIQHLPWARSKYRSYLPLMPLAVEQLDVSAYDLVISSSHAVAKGVLTGPDQLHVCYCHTPIRYAWDLQHQYLEEAGLEKGIKAWMARWLLHKIRLWDVRTANGVDNFVANSNFIRRRIHKVYRREAQVIYPPVDVERFALKETKEDFYFTASRMVPYKKMPMIVDAFSRMPDRRLVVIGDGPDMAQCRALAGPNVQIMGYQSDEVLRDHMQRAKAFVFAAEEDFGITPIEAQACGTPVIAFGKGGALETVRGLTAVKPTGLFFDEQTPESLMEAVIQFEQTGATRIQAQACRENAERFSSQRFRQEFSDFVTARWSEFQLKRQEGCT